MRNGSIPVLVVVLVALTGCIGASTSLDGSGDGVVVESPPENLTGNLTGDEVRVQSEDDDLLVAYSIRDRDLFGGTEAAIEVIAAHNDSSRHYCPGDASGVLRVPVSPRAESGYTVALSEDDRLLPPSPCRATDGGFGTSGSIATAQWEPRGADRQG